MRRRKIFKIVRVGEPSAHLIGHVLDYGADGIMVPHICDAAAAENVVKAMRYPPLGDRGFSTSVRAFKYGMNIPKDMTTYSSPLFMAQIENYEGVTNVDSIAAVDGVDVLFVGPRDLGLDLSVRPKDRTYEFDDAIAKVAAAALKHGKQAGILVRNPDDIQKFREMGFTALAAGSDMGMLKSGYSSLLKNILAMRMIVFLMTLPLFLSCSGSVSEQEPEEPALVPVKVNVNPLPEYSVSNLDFAMMCGGVAHTQGKRLWAFWTAGGDSGKAFTVLMHSDDDGASWSDVDVVLDAHEPGRECKTMGGCLWTDPEGRLWAFTGSLCPTLTAGAALGTFDATIQILTGRYGLILSEYGMVRRQTRR